MKHVNTFENFEDDIELYAKLTINIPESNSPDFFDQFEQLWTPEQIDDTPTYRIYVFDMNGYRELQAFLDRKLGTRNYKLEIE